jgi:hypothetical protein
MSEPSKREWFIAWLDGLERSAFTGTVALTLQLERGSIARLVVREASWPPKPPCCGRRPLCSVPAPSRPLWRPHW